MPCYTVRLISVIFKAQNLKILEEAARLLNKPFIKIGLNLYQIGTGDTRVLVDVKAEKAEARYQDNINALKVAYARAAVKEAAKVKGWTLDTWKTDTTSKTLKTVATKY